MRIETRRNFLGAEYELRIESNGHSATNGGGCSCMECQRLRIAENRCPECGGPIRKSGYLTKCVGCSASGLGA